jgi:hypothetical protein
MKGAAMNTRRLAVPAALLAGTCTVGLVLAGNMEGAENSASRGVRNDFSNATLNDRYGFHVIAFRGSVPFAVSGFYRFNGKFTLRKQNTD